MAELFDLNRFLRAQDFAYRTALEEIKDGYKCTHWIWYIFPQIDGLGHSPNARYYGIKSLMEAKAYYENDTLRNRLEEITRALLDHTGEDAEDILGGIDAKKVRSCMTLFDIISPEDIFEEVLNEFYGGTRCQRTLSLVSEERRLYHENPFTKYGLRVQDKGFWELGSYESNTYGTSEKLGTILDMVSRGETILGLVSNYLYNRDLTPYRVSGVESMLWHYVVTFLNVVSEEAEGQSEKQYAMELLDAFDANHLEKSVFVLASEFDEIIQKIASHPTLNSAIELLKRNTLIKR